MGVIEDGTITGIVPETEGFAVHYPGYPSSTSSAITTLGGMEEITKRRSSNSKYIECRFRPDDPYSHPTFGDLRSSNSLLLRISKKKPPPIVQSTPPGECPGDEQSTQPPTQLCADIVARVRQAYHFEGMVDYQFVVAVHAEESRKKKRRRGDVEINSVEKGGLIDLDQEDIMMLVPPLFALKDIPEEILLKPPSNLVSTQLQRGMAQKRWEMDLDPCLALPFETEKIPRKFCWEDNISKDTVEWECQMAVSKLFDERPIWPRRSLHERLVDDGQKISNHQMRRLLYRSGYYFSTGPFGKFWIRKGYDPRIDPESKIYQKVDFRMPEPIRKFGNSTAKNRLEVRWKDICHFRAIPSQNFTCLQFFELEDQYIEQEIRKPAQKKTCTHSTGWLSTVMLEILRLHVKIRFLSIFENDVAENLLRDTRKQLEKTKRMLLDGELDPEGENPHVNGCLGPDEEETPNINRDPDEEENPHVSPESERHAFPEVTVMKSSNLQPVREDEDNLDEPGDCEVDEEEEPEEEDGYESPSVACGDSRTTPNRCSNNFGENISTDYLQEILCGFHSKEGNEFQFNEQAADTSDGEYQVYEQDSDNDDFFDDEDGFS